VIKETIAKANAIISTRHAAIKKNGCVAQCTSAKGKWVRGLFLSQGLERGFK
jgi:hypothetical protein